jgi:superoxide dismutase, Fe-Mn family
MNATTRFTTDITEQDVALRAATPREPIIPSAQTGLAATTERYRLPELPYDPAALEPWCSAETISLHHDRHHAAYVAGANKALGALQSARANDQWASINQLEADLAFHVSGHVLHSIFWDNLAPDADERPVGELAAAIDDSFGDFETFRSQFTHAATAVQGSGWAALAWEPVGQCLVVVQIHDHQSTTVQGSDLLLVCDVWEHAYYLQYRNARADWLEAFWHIVNWRDVEARLVGTTLYDTKLPGLFT